MAIIEGQPTARRGMAAAIGPGQRAERHRRERRAEGGEPSLRDGHPGDARQPCERGHIARLALVGRHAERGVAFEMLDRAIAFSPGEIYVGGGHVILEIDEAGFGVGQVGNSRADRWKIARCRADARHRLPRCAGHERLDRLVPIERAARLTVQMHDRGEAPRNRQQIGLEARALGPDIGLDRMQMMAFSGGRDWEGIGVDRVRGGAGDGALFGARIQNGDDGAARRRNRVGSGIGIVIVGGDDDALAGQHLEPSDIAAHRLRQHHAGAVIAGKGQRALDCAGREHDAARADMP